MSPTSGGRAVGIVRLGTEFQGVLFGRGGLYPRLVPDVQYTAPAFLPNPFQFIFLGLSIVQRYKLL
jgi:hypothetical protein